jgi:hypothetical protein
MYVGEKDDEIRIMTFALGTGGCKRGDCRVRAGQKTSACKFHIKAHPFPSPI